MNLSDLLSGTRGTIVDLIRGGTESVVEIAASLGLTDNAVRAHLTGLERDGVIESGGRRKGLRKPTQLYRLTDAAEAFYLRAYEPILIELARTLRETTTPEERSQIFAKVGTRLAAPVTGEGFEERLANLVILLSKLGALASVERTAAGSIIIAGRKCPIGALVAECPEACSIVEGIIGAGLRVPVQKLCIHEGQPACRFLVSEA